MLNTASPERRLAAAAAGTLTRYGGAEFEAMVAAITDWELVLEIASTHSLEPALYRHLTADELGIPQTVLERLADSYHTTLKRGLYLTDELGQLTDRFEERGVDVIPFKGPALAQLAYGDIAARSYGDLDFIARREDLPAVIDTLQSAGYPCVRSHSAAPRPSSASTPSSTAVQCFAHLASITSSGRRTPRTSK